MRTFHSFDELLHAVDALHWDGAVFIDPSAWDENPVTASLLLLEGDDELEDLDSPSSHIPRAAAELGMKQLLDVQTLQDVVGFERKRNPIATVSEVVHAINYYRERDDFYDPDRKG
jgi:hypothetical protein